MRNWKKWGLAALILAVALGLYFKSGQNGGETKVLATAGVRYGDVRKVLQATGIVKAQVGAIVKIGARATGYISRMLVKVGDWVNKGDLIAEIDAREAEAGREQAEATLKKTQAELERVQTVYPLKLVEAKAQMDLAQAQNVYAATNLGRQSQLLSKDLIAKDTEDTAKREADVAVNQVRARKATLDSLDAEYRKELVKAQKAVAESEAAFEAATIKLSYTKIYSPIDGVVSQVTSQEGETVVAGLQVANLITVLDPARLEMWIYVDETDVGQVKKGMSVTFRVDAYPDAVFTGAIDQVYPQPEIRDNIVYYQTLVPIGPEDAVKLRPEMTTQCQITVKEKKNVLVIPNEALKWVGLGQAVFVDQGGGAVRQAKPELGLAGLRETEVVSGLEAGEKVATQIVLPGAPKSPSQPAPPPPPQQPPARQQGSSRQPRT
jgi:multidrug efflux pump subunit AcrA (membrane-fusion protein)